MARYTALPTTIQDMQKRVNHEPSTLVQDDEPSEEEMCGEDLARGGTCERPANSCPYHGERDV